MPRTRTLAQVHLDRMTAREAVIDGVNATLRPHARNAYELLRLKLAEDKRTLKSIESIQLKIDTKRELLPAYSDYIHAVLQSGTGSPDDIVMTIMLWRIDVGDFRGALDIAHYALRHGLSMPDAYQRKPQSVLAEEVADTAAALLTAGESVDVALLKETQLLTAPFDMADQIRAKLCKVLGKATEETDPAYALQQYIEAQRLNEKSGVKAIINRLSKQLQLTDAPVSDEPLAEPVTP